jgi:hypothetical protein
MHFETQMPPYKENSEGGHYRQKARSMLGGKELRYQQKGLVTWNKHMKYMYESPINYHRQC